MQLAEYLQADGALADSLLPRHGHDAVKVERLEAAEQLHAAAQAGVGALILAFAHSVLHVHLLAELLQHAGISGCGE